MIRGASGLIAHQLETVAGVITRPLYSNKNLFVVDGAPGVWRQVANPNVSDPSDRAIVYAAFGGGKISLTFDVLVNAEFELAGILWGAKDVAAEVAAAITKAKELAAANPPTLLTAAAEEAAESGRVAVMPEPAAPRVPRKRAAGSVVTPTTLPSVTAADGTPLPGSLAAAGLGADPVPPPAAPVEHDPPPAPGDVAADTGFAPIDELEI